ncbi:MAG: tyrosine-type recombinase/integrase [Streptosporangiaceae bacterium]
MNAMSIATRVRPHTLSAERSRSYVTHLIEAGWDPLFVQQQAGHEHASTTAIYTCVSSDFRTRTLRRALDATAAAAMRPGRGA